MARGPKSQRIRPLPRGFAKLAGRVAANARRLREARGWTQAEAASKSSLDDRAYREVESGRANLTLAMLLRVARAYDDDVASLLVPTSSWSPRRPGRPPTPLPALVAVKPNPSHREPSELDVAVQELVGGDEAVLARLPEGRLLAQRAALLATLERIDATLRQRGVAMTPSAEGTGARGVSVPVALPSGRWPNLRDFVLALLAANASGLLAFEIVEAARGAKLKLRDNEVHTVLQGLLRRRAISREGRAGTFVYRLSPPEVGASRS